MYGDDHEFSLSDNAPTGLKVSIALPLQFAPGKRESNREDEAAKLAQA